MKSKTFELDFLMQLLEKFLQEINTERLEENIMQSLADIGVAPDNLRSFLAWLKEHVQHDSKQSIDTVNLSHGMRIFSDYEIEQLGEGLSYLLELEKLGLLNPNQREMIIDRALIKAQKDQPLPLKQFKLLVLSVLRETNTSHFLQAIMHDVNYNQDIVH